jgi:hypothetical protein
VTLATFLVLVPRSLDSWTHSNLFPGFGIAAAAFSVFVIYDNVVGHASKTVAHGKEEGHGH